MFNKERKLLKELQEIQTQIYDYNSRIKCLEQPKTTYKIAQDLSDYFQYIAHDISDCSRWLNREKDTLSYLEELGNYLVNVAKYEKDKQTYKAELIKLQEEESRIKDKLGIK